MSTGWTVAILGATGAVGRAMSDILAEAPIEVKELRLLCTPRSEGSKIRFRERTLETQAVSASAFTGVDLALFSAGATASEAWAPVARDAGAWVVDNSSRFRMDREVALIVPEVNHHRIPLEPAVIANPNCSTIQMVMALGPLRDRFGLEEVFVSTYQSASGVGEKGVRALRNELAGEPHDENGYRFPHRLAGNVVPQCDVFLDDGYTREEEKMIRETQKILERPDLPVHPTCVRVPVLVSHSEAVYARLGREFDLEEVRATLATSPGIRVLDDPASSSYPTAASATGTDPVWVGRLRRDRSDPRGVHLWIVADNLRKGAALNAVQIAQRLWDRRAAGLWQASR
jgi:aspartate-semialdehyde dehydrogenase